MHRQPSGHRIKHAIGSVILIINHRGKSIPSPMNQTGDLFRVREQPPNVELRRHAVVALTIVLPRPARSLLFLGGCHSL